MKKSFAFLVAGLFAGTAVAAGACGSSDDTTSAVTSTATTGNPSTTTSAAGGGGAGGTGGTGTTGGGGATSTGSSSPLSICQAIALTPDQPTGAGGGAGGSGAGGGAVACASECVAEFPHGYQRFGCYQLENCACAGASSPCASACTAECADPTILSGESPATDPCAVCLAQQANDGTNSTCTVTTLFTDCFDTSDNGVCKPFGMCAEGCI